jgi:hypothetical protein
MAATVGDMWRRCVTGVTDAPRLRNDDRHHPAAIAVSVVLVPWMFRRLRLRDGARGIGIALGSGSPAVRLGRSGAPELSFRRQSFHPMPIRPAWFAPAVALLGAAALFFADAATAFAASEAVASLVTLTWTAPGDDDTIGRATRYDLRYSPTPITSTNFAQATPVLGLPVPALAGTTEVCSVGGLASGANYYFAIKTVDEAGNWSPISNVLAKQAPVTGVGDGGLELSLANPWPSPARHISAGPIDVRIYDVVGRVVRTLASGWREAGRGELVWDLKDQSGRPAMTGMYLMRARLGGRDWSRRVLIVR